MALMWPTSGASTQTSATSESTGISSDDLIVYGLTGLWLPHKLVFVVII